MTITKSCFLLGILLLLTERLHFAHGVDGCEWCQGGTLNNPETLIALTTPDQVRSCQEWQQTSSLTENLSDETCIFVGPFYEAICGCSNLSPIYDQCDLCGSPEMVLRNPSKGLMIPNSNSQKTLCGVIYSGVQKGAVQVGATDNWRRRGGGFLIKHYLIMVIDRLTNVVSYLISLMINHCISCMYI